MRSRYPDQLKVNQWGKWMVASGVMAGLALPSIGTFYALRLQYPHDAFIMGLSIASLMLILATVCAFGVGVSLITIGIAKGEHERRINWAARGMSMRQTLQYREQILKRESALFTRLYVDEQEFRDANPEKGQRHKERAELSLQRVEVLGAQQALADLKADYLKLMPRTDRRRTINEWAAMDQA